MSDEVERVELRIPVFPAGARVWFDPNRIEPVNAELLDNPNDRTNFEIAVDALAEGDCSGYRRRDDGMCGYFWEQDDAEPVRGWGDCICQREARKMIDALEAAGRLKPNAGSARAALGEAEDES